MPPGARPHDDVDLAVAAAVADGRADRVLMVPREGFGFSRNAPVRMGPPSFDSAAFQVGTSAVSHTIRMRYLL